ERNGEYQEDHYESFPAGRGAAYIIERNVRRRRPFFLSDEVYKPDEVWIKPDAHKSHTEYKQCRRRKHQRILHGGGGVGNSLLDEHLLLPVVPPQPDYRQNRHEEVKIRSLPQRLAL